MKKLVFCVDCDEVLRSLLKNMVKVYNREFYDTMTTEDVKFFDVSKSFPRIEQETGINPQTWFFTLHGRELFLDSEAIEGSWQAMELLNRLGTVIIVTRQYGYENKINTLTWLSNHEMPCSGICFLDDKSLIKCDYFIDDNVDNFKGISATCGVLITTPYNKKFKDGDETKDYAMAEILKNTSISYGYRFDNLLEFAKYIEKNYGN